MEQNNNQEQESNILDIITNDDLFYEKIEPFLWPEARKQVYHKVAERIPPGMSQLVLGAMIIGIPHRENMRTIGGYLMGLWKQGVIAGIGCVNRPVCKELPMENKRRRFIIQTTVYTAKSLEQIMKDTDWKFISTPKEIVVQDQDLLPTCVITNAYSPEENIPDISKEKMQEEFDSHTKKKLEDYIKDPAVIDQARFIANTIDERIKGNNWITLDQILKKTTIGKDLQEVFNLVNILCLTGFAVRKEFDGGIIKYKLTLSPEDRIAMMQEQKNVYLLRIAQIDADIEREQAKITSSPATE